MRATTFITFVALLWAATALSSAAMEHLEPVRNPQAAFDRVKVQVAARYKVEVRKIAFCDMLSRNGSPKGYYVMALHGRRPDCDGICSTNMGWFAIRKSTGRVFEWDVSDMKIGQPLDAGL